MSTPEKPFIPPLDSPPKQRRDPSAPGTTPAQPPGNAPRAPERGPNRADPFPLDPAATRVNASSPRAIGPIAPGVNPPVREPQMPERNEPAEPLDPPRRDPELPAGPLAPEKLSPTKQGVAKR